jgi:hypothetical protein
MCVHNVDGQRGWTGECPDSGRCLCGYFPELGHQQHRQRGSVVRTVAWLAAGFVAVLAALSVLVWWLFKPEDERTRLSTLGR